VYSRFKASNDEEFDFGPSDQHDVDHDEDGSCPSGARPTDPLEHFILELDDLAASAAERTRTQCGHAKGGSGGKLYNM
jgi:hypothetical protein